MTFHPKKQKMAMTSVYVTHKKFMPLSSPGFGMNPAYNHSAIQPSAIYPNSFEMNASFTATESQKQSLPDIFTTCPELLKSKVPVLMPSPVQRNEFNLPPQQSVPQTKFMPPPPPQQVIYQKYIPRPVHYQRPPLHIPTPQSPPMQPLYITFDPNAQIIKPKELGFVPACEWTSQVFSLTELRNNFFTRRNGIGRVFPIKLYHALLITKAYPESYYFTGVIWITNDVFKVNAQIFANLLGIHSVQGGLFHKQGNFTRHQYSQVMIQSSREFQALPECQDVDDFNIRLFNDPQNRFTRDTEYKVELDPSLLNFE